MGDEERQARRGLACVIESGDPRGGQLLDRLGAVEGWRVLRSTKADSVWSSRARAVRLDDVRRAEAREGLRFLIPGDEEWPVSLGDLRRCPEVQDLGGEPLGLWVRGSGRLSALLVRSVGVVGSRASSAYGDRVAGDLAAGLVADGCCVVSGGAYGIDAAAHRAALADDGPTVAFVAGGVDEPYPRAHAELLSRISARGCVVSEHPPGEHPTRRRFLARNRLIAAGTQGTVMVEAAVRSGARNTVSWATACGRPVMAVPGPVGNATSFTPHRLIREGEAVLVTCAADVRELLSPLLAASAPDRPRQARLLDVLDPREAAVHEALPGRGSRPVGEIALRAGLGVRDCLASLECLAGMGLAESAPGGQWRLGRVQDRPLLERERAAEAAAGRDV